MRIFLLYFLLLLSASGFSQITKTEFAALWAANTAKYNAATADKDKAKATTLTTAMEKKYPADASVMLSRGVYYYNFNGDDNKALTAFTKAITAKPGYIQAYLYRAKVLAKKGVYEKAMSDLSVVLEKDPQNVAAYTDRGGYYFAIKDYENALKDFRAVMQIEPANPSGYNDAGNTLNLLGRKSEAVTMYTTALSRPSSDTAALLCFYGKYLAGEQKFPEALAQYEKAMKIKGASLYADNYNTAGLAAYKTKAYIPAETYLTEAIKLDPANINYYDNKASVYLDQKDWNAIIRTAITMLRIDANNAKANMLMYVGYIKSDRDESTGLIFKERAAGLDKAGTTAVAVPDSVLFFLPKEARSSTAHTTSAAYVNAYNKYVTNFAALDSTQWSLIERKTFEENESLFNFYKNGKPVTPVIKNGKVYLENTLTADLSLNFTMTAIYNVDKDIWLKTVFTVTKADSTGMVGLFAVTKGTAPIYYYFLVNPVIKKYYIGWQQTGKSGVYHSLADPGNKAIPGLNEETTLQVITKNGELAFTVNGVVLEQLALSRFTEINLGNANGFYAEKVISAEVDYFATRQSMSSMSSDAVATLGWKPAIVQQAAPQKVRRLLGTMIVYSPPINGRSYANLFGIYGDAMTDEQAVFSRMASKLNSYYTYTKYTWKPGYEPGVITKGWDLRDYDYKGSYYTTGEAVY